MTGCCQTGEHSGVRRLEECYHRLYDEVINVYRQIRWYNKPYSVLQKQTTVFVMECTTYLILMLHNACKIE